MFMYLLVVRKLRRKRHKKHPCGTWMVSWALYRSSLQKPRSRTW